VSRSSRGGLMASMWRKAMLYLGLGPDDEYDDFDVTGEHQQPAAPTGGSRPSRRTSAGSSQRDLEPTGSVRTLPPSSGDDLTGTGTGTGNGHGHGGVRAGGRDPGGESSLATRRADERGGRLRSAVARPLPAGPTKPFVVGPTSFNDAQDVADKFKVNVPVILNLQGVERDLSRRIIDFASGLCYGLGGQMERVANHVYLLTPSDVEVSLEERRRLRERGYEA
ncbi:MAG TPA: cell division protein SepF, partial [Acidimicrobiales bacterium]|nr:cell division protein SepF [Acidimicrobiales bacterium]